MKKAKKSKMEDFLQVQIKTENLDEIQTNQIFLSNTNPWLVSNLKEFLWYNCPECEYKAKNEDLFYEHAIKNHFKAQQCLNIKNEFINNDVMETSVDPLDTNDNLEASNFMKQRLENYNGLSKINLINNNTFKMNNNIYKDISDELGALVEFEPLVCCNVGMYHSKICPENSVSRNFRNFPIAV